MGGLFTVDLLLYVKAKQKHVLSRVLGEIQKGKFSE
jgi:hypothetical protein